MKRVIAKTDNGWKMDLSEMNPGFEAGNEKEQLSEYLDETRFPYRKKGNEFLFPDSLSERVLLEVIGFFYDGISEVEVLLDLKPPNQSVQTIRVSASRRPSCLTSDVRRSHE